MSKLYSHEIVRQEMLSPLDQLFRHILIKALSNIKSGQLTLHENGSSLSFGERNQTGLHADIQIRDSKFYKKVVLGGSIGAGESFMDGHWATSNLTHVIQIFARNLTVIDQMDNKLSLLQRITGKALHWMNKNTLSGSQKNISAHYDLSNDFFRHFLDNSMMYSSAIFQSPQDSLENASLNKLERVCQQLQLSERDHLLEIGTGWGGMAIYAAKNYGCKVTSATISKEQFEYAKKQVQEQGLENQITLLLEDYRHLKGEYDKLVSIEMIEAVGDKFLSSYFEKCSSLLKSDGLMLIQAITIPDQRYDYYKKENDFIKQYIFPGGHLPSLAIINKCISTKTDFQLIDLKDIGFDYAHTLRHWNDRMMSNHEKIKSLGFDKRFLRMWQFYFSYCEGGFLEQNISTAQILLSKPKGKTKRIFHA